MKIIVCGAGEVGLNIAKQLVEEDNDVTIIDESEDLLRLINQSLDVKTVCGKTSFPDILSKGGAEEADILISVLENDEMNMVTCQISKHIFKIPSTISKIKESNYLDKKWLKLFSDKCLSVDHIISPEIEIANEIIRKLNTPGAFDSFSLGNDLINVIGITINSDCPIINTPLRMLPGIFSGLEIKILVIYRGEEIIIPTGKVEIYPNDEIYFLVRSNELKRALRVFGIKSQETRKIVIIGLGTIGTYLLKKIEKEFPDVICKVIESNIKRSEEVVNKLSDQTVILNGNALDKELLIEAGVAGAEAVVSVTDDDEVNIFSTLLAKELGCLRSFAILNNSIYRQLARKLDLDVMISPKNNTISAILRHVRKGKVREIHDFGDKRGEIMEIEILPTSKFADKKIIELNLSEGIIIGAILREKDVYFADDEFSLQINDKLILFSDSQSIKEVEKFSEVNIEFF